MGQAGGGGWGDWAGRGSVAGSRSRLCLLRRSEAPVLPSVRLQGRGGRLPRRYCCCWSNQWAGRLWARCSCSAPHCWHFQHSTPFSAPLIIQWWGGQREGAGAVGESITVSLCCATHPLGGRSIQAQRDGQTRAEGTGWAPVSPWTSGVSLITPNAASAHAPDWLGRRADSAPAGCPQSTHCRPCCAALGVRSRP